MPSLIRRYGFAAAVAAVLALMVVVVVIKSVLPDGDARGQPGAMAGGGAGGPPGGGRPGGGRPGGPGGPGGGETPMVQVTRVQMSTFSDAIQALGTAQARESITITPEAADTIRRIRFESGDRVRSGQVLVEMTSVEQEAGLAEAAAANDAAQEELRRFQELFDRGFAPRARLDAARAAAGAAQARVNAGRSRVNDRTLRAPFSGVMGLRTASPGQFVNPGTAIGTLDDISEIKLDFDVPENQMARVARGVSIVARTPAYPQQEFTGRIAQVDSRVSTQTRTLRVRALLPNRDERLRPGMLMTVEIRSNPRQALAAPEPAVVDDSAGPYVYVVASEGGRMAAQRRQVRTGQRTNGMVEILDGLAAGDQVITEGIQRVRPGQNVRLGGAGGPPGAGRPTGAGSSPPQRGGDLRPGGVAPRTNSSASGAARAG